MSKRVFIGGIMYKNILLKLSGESLMSEKENIDKDKTLEIAKLIKKVHDMGINVGIVVGGGNFFEVEVIKIWNQLMLIQWECLELR